jgi:hypothetical protein
VKTDGFFLFDFADLHCRACPGRHFGESNVWLAIAGITAAFSITKALDELGQEITPPEAFTSGFVRYVDWLLFTATYYLLSNFG